MSVLPDVLPGTPDLGRRWCPDCRTRQPIDDIHAESAYTGGAIETHYKVTDLACGHQIQDKIAETFTAPGGHDGPNLTAALATRRQLPNPWTAC